MTTLLAETLGFIRVAFLWILDELYICGGVGE